MILAAQCGNEDDVHARASLEISMKKNKESGSGQGIDEIHDDLYSTGKTGMEIWSTIR